MKEKSPLVSIIVPNYNHENYLKERLDTIFNQTYKNIEVILLDDCSIDGSQSILSEYSLKYKVSHCVFNKTNSGNTFIQWEKGISLAKGDYIWIAESDDFCELNFLESLIQPLISKPQVVLSYCQSNRVDEFGKIRGNWLSHTDCLDKKLFLSNFIMSGNNFIEYFLIKRNVIPNVSAVLLRKSAVDLIGKFDKDSYLKTCGDWLFYIKLITSKQIAFNSRSLNNYRFHKDSVIAVAYENGEFEVDKDVEINIRKKFIIHFKEHTIKNSTIILKENKKILNNLKYFKAIYLIKNKKKVDGILILSSIIPLTFRKNYWIRKFVSFIKRKLTSAKVFFCNI